MKPRKKRFKRFTIKEISAVTVPAQPQALARVMKQDDQTFTKLVRVEPTEQQKLAAALDRVAKGTHDKPKEKVMTENDPMGYATLDEAVAAIRKAEGCGGAEAMSKARSDYPQLYQRYQTQGEAEIAKRLEEHEAEAERIVKESRAKQEFDILAQGIKMKEECSNAEAYRRARRRHPQAYENMQNAG